MKVNGIYDELRQKITGCKLLMGELLPTTSANGVIHLGNIATTGTLIYTGAGEPTNRVIGFDGSTGGGAHP